MTMGHPRAWTSGQTSTVTTTRRWTAVSPRTAQSVLNTGCGDGLLASRLSRRIPTVVVLDRNELALPCENAISRRPGDVALRGPPGHRVAAGPVRRGPGQRDSAPPWRDINSPTRTVGLGVPRWGTDGRGCPYGLRQAVRAHSTQVLPGAHTSRLAYRRYLIYWHKPERLAPQRAPGSGLPATRDLVRPEALPHECRQLLATVETTPHTDDRRQSIFTHVAPKHSNSGG